MVLTFEQASEAVLAYCRRILQNRSPQAEEVPLLHALGRILAGPVAADRDFPPFPRATRDGYAVRAADLHPAREQNAPGDNASVNQERNGAVVLRVVGQVKAGDSYDLPLAAGEAVEIMTGAAVPQGADAVVMVEHTARVKTNHEEHSSDSHSPGRSSSSRDEGSFGTGHEAQKPAESAAAAGPDDILEGLSAQGLSQQVLSESGPPVPAIEDDLVEIQRAVAAGENVVAAGAEAKAGQELLPRGTRLGPAQIALAASAGKAALQVCRKPRVAILSTGDELVDVAEKPGPSQIRNSNSYSLAAEVAAFGGEPVQLPIAPDEEGKLTELVQEGLKADMLLLSGGVSMGKFDLVETVLHALGAEFYFTGAMIQPGKPVVFGQVRETPFFGLPGNPVSVMVTFELFARQVLEALAGGAPSRPRSAQARLQKEFRTKTGLTRFLPAVLSGGLDEPAVELVPWQGSGDLLAASRANCYLVVPPDRERLAAGEMVTVVFLTARP